MIYFFVNECGINPADKTSDGWDPLLLICRYYDGGQHNDLKVLLDFLVEDYGIDPSRKNQAYNKESGNAFLFACRYYRGRDLKQLLESLIDKGGYDVNKTLDVVNKNSNALHIFCSSSYTGNDLLQLVTFLIEEKGITVNTCDTNGWNALHLLCTAYSGSQFDEIVSFLCTKGIDINQLTSEGYDAIFIRLYRVSYKFSSLKDLEILINQKGFDVNAFMHNSNNELMSFFFRTNGGFSDILELL